MNNDLISREALRKNMEFICMGIMAGTEPYNAPLTEIDNAPTVEITEEQAIDKLHKTGWLPRHDKEMTERPQGECKCVTCKYRSCEITEKPCRECSRSWADLYEEADMKGGAK